MKKDLQCGAISQNCGRRSASFARCLAAVSLVLAIDAANHDHAQGAIRNRYSFSNPAGPAIHGESVIQDLVGPHDGIVKGANGVFTGSAMVFPGGTHAAGGAYVDLPNGMISSIETDATFEAWYTLNSTVDDWVRIFDFGDNRAMDGVWIEIFEPGPITGNAGDTFFYSPMRGTNPNLQRVTIENDGPDSGHVPPIPGVVNFGSIQIDTSVTQIIGEQQHVAITYVRDADGAGPNEVPAISIFFNGVHTGTVAGGATTPYQLVNLHDVNNWLGRSNYSADNMLNGSINEFRIYDHAFNADQAMESFLRGPGEVPEPATLLSLFSGCLAAGFFVGRGRRTIL